jgi:hypothetical protein
MQAANQAPELTLLDLVAAASDVTTEEAETVLIVETLLRSGRVRLAGEFRECHLDADPGKGAPLNA